MDEIDLEEARQDIPGATHTELMALAYKLVARAERAEADLAALRERQPCDHCQTTHAPITPSCCEKSEALAEERGRVIESFLAEVEKERTVFLDQCGLMEWESVASIRKQMRNEIAKAIRALTPEPAKEDGSNG